MEAHHDHPPDAACLPACPAWAEGCLQLFALRRRYPEMLEACRTAAQIEFVVVAPSAPGVDGGEAGRLPRAAATGGRRL